MLSVGVLHNCLFFIGRYLSKLNTLEGTQHFFSAYAQLLDAFGHMGCGGVPYSFTGGVRLRDQSRRKPRPFAFIIFSLYWMVNKICPNTVHSGSKFCLAHSFFLQLFRLLLAKEEWRIQNTNQWMHVS